MMITSRVNILSASILFLAGDGNYTHIHFSKKSSALYATTLSVFEKELPGFVRIHKKYLVNPAYVTDYRANGPRSIEVMIGGQWLPVSRRRMDEVEAALTQLEEMV